MSSQIRGFSMATQRILIRSQILQPELKERRKRRNAYTDHVMVRSELKYLIAAKIVNLKCQVLVGKTGPFPTVRVFLVVRPDAKVRHREESDPEPAWQFTPVSNTTTNQPQANRILLEANCQKDGAGQL
jgi:hypothetical protein